MSVRDLRNIYDEKYVYIILDRNSDIIKLDKEKGIVLCQDMKKKQ